MTVSAAPPLDADGRRPLRGQFAAVEILDGLPAIEILDPQGIAAIAARVAQRKASPQTRRTYAGVYRQFVAFAGVHAVAGDVDEQLVISYRDHLERRGLSPATIAKHLSAVRELVREAGGPATALQVRSEKVAKGQPRPLTDEQARRLLAMPDLRTTRGVRDRAVLELLLSAGLRRAELAHLTIRSIEETRRHASGGLRAAVAASTSWTLRVRRAKGGKERVVPLSAAAVSALRDWMGRRPACDHDALFVSIPRHGGQRPAPLSTTAVWRIVTGYAKAAGLHDGVTPHALRHTFATRIAEADVPLDVLQDLLGHSDPRTTTIYAQRRAAAAAEAIAAVERRSLPASRL